MLLLPWDPDGRRELFAEDNGNVWLMLVPYGGWVGGSGSEAGIIGWWDAGVPRYVRGGETPEIGDALVVGIVMGEEEGGDE